MLILVSKCEKWCCCCCCSVDVQANSPSLSDWWPIHHSSGFLVIRRKYFTVTVSSNSLLTTTKIKRSKSIFAKIDVIRVKLYVCPLTVSLLSINKMIKNRVPDSTLLFVRWKWYGIIMLLIWVDGRCSFDIGQFRSQVNAELTFGGDYAHDKVGEEGNNCLQLQVQ